ncbi:MAG: PEPxxWA-CTERM sorting domain-containing protein [Sphingomonadaceae bacterium]|nr:PEPxxWA-CTERM sorting domain-containing protein [Sphingomonadaceae bacterium]
MPGIPEPASWALMLAGFGLVGGLARQRRYAVVAA